MWPLVAVISDCNCQQYKCTDECKSDSGNLDGTV